MDDYLASSGDFPEYSVVVKGDILRVEKLALVDYVTDSGVKAEVRLTSDGKRYIVPFTLFEGSTANGDLRFSPQYLSLKRAE
ncbi:MAG: hypothetical protein O3C21_08890 [Verrucomicrobia bacterium]|nr:hypothetical protein [Verrucomicrobiota bacterium]